MLPPTNMVQSDLYTFGGVKYPISLLAAHCALHRLLKILQGTKLTKVMTTPNMTHPQVQWSCLVHSLGHYWISESLSAEETSKW